ncbi:hypothetical protein DER46DRAFT_576416 [Fusarium sp. MPI-SDFR-AT-0072]|nr:hypothetical protein DER46DRAFT_576416 [Fusarium sp. MPI-SDFR-AT-0072]
MWSLHMPRIVRIWYSVIGLAAICGGGALTCATPLYILIDLTRHIRISGATCIFTDPQRLDIAIHAADAAGLLRASIIIVEKDDKDRKTPPEGFHGTHNLLDMP